MGESISWIAFKGIGRSAGLERLALRESDATASFGAVPFAGHALPQEWFLVVARGYGSRLVSEHTLSALSADCSVIACSIEEHVMCSSAEGWSRGRRDWRIAHDGQESTRHIECDGDPPPRFAEALREARSSQDAEDAGGQEVDFFFDIPLDVARAITGFKHDEDMAGVDSDAFAVLEKVGDGSKRKWWKIW